jgi:hypothetical protein
MMEELRRLMGIRNRSEESAQIDPETRLELVERKIRHLENQEEGIDEEELARLVQIRRSLSVELRKRELMRELEDIERNNFKSIGMFY